MKKVRLVIVSAIVVSTILGSVLIFGFVKPVSSGAAAATFEYRAKWICNIPSPFVSAQPSLDTNAAESIGLVPGEYKTDINVHNPSHSLNVTMLKKFVVSTPEPTGQLRPLTAFVRATLFPDGAFFVECGEILHLFPQICAPPTPTSCTAKGFVILSGLSSTGGIGFASPNTLDVVGEYSAESFAPVPTTTTPASQFCIFPLTGTSAVPCVSTGISLDVERIPAAPFVA